MTPATRHNVSTWHVENRHLSGETDLAHNRPLVRVKVLHHVSHAAVSEDGISIGRRVDQGPVGV